MPATMTGAIASGATVCTSYLSNDSDLGLDHTNEAVGPYTLRRRAGSVSR